MEKRIRFSSILLLVCFFFSALCVAREGLCQEGGGVSVDIKVKADGKALFSAIGKYLDKQKEELSEVADTERTEEGVKVKMKSKILFNFDSFELKDTAKVELEKISKVLVKYPENVIVVEGHTDSSGEEDYNQTLSENRAKAVTDYLVSLGLADNSITFVGYGEAMPVASNDTPEGQEQNRRVEVDITVDEKKFKEKHKVEKKPVCPACPEADKRRYTDKMTMELGSRVSFSGVFYQNNYNRYQIMLGPLYGIFVFKGLQVGLKPVFYYYNDDPSGADNKTTEMNIGIFVSLAYVLDLKKIVFPYFQLNVGGFWGRETYHDSIGNQIKANKNSVGFGPEVGLKILVGRNGIISLGVQYLYETIGVTNKSTRDNRHSFFLDLGFGFWF